MSQNTPSNVKNRKPSFCHVFGIIFDDFWNLFGLHFSSFSDHFRISFLYFSALRFCIDFYMVFGWILDHFWCLFRWLFRPNSENVNFVKCVVFYWKNNDFQGLTPSFVHVFLIYFWLKFDIEFCIDLSWFWEPFWHHVPCLFDPLAIILAYFFGVEIFMIFGCHFGQLLALNL